ncbi:uncharacterized protein LOC144436220 [Glandiceps talaboti]
MICKESSGTSDSKWKKVDMALKLAMLLCVFKYTLASGELTCQITDYQQGWTSQNGVRRCCDNCAKGKYMTQPCQIGQPATTQCATCHYGTYTDIPNLLRACQFLYPCREAEHRVVKIQGSKTNQYVCECESGYYELHEGSCRSWTKCGIGSGVLTLGSATEDVTCQVCPPGTYSDRVDKTSKCIPHTKCEVHGLVTVESGTGSSDATCDGPTVTPSDISMLQTFTGNAGKSEGNGLQGIYVILIVILVLVVLIIIIILAILCVKNRWNRNIYKPSGYRTYIAENASPCNKESKECKVFIPRKQDYIEVIGNPAAPPSILSDAKTDNLPLGAEAVGFGNPEHQPSSNSGTASTITSGLTQDNACPSETPLKVPIAMSQSDFRGNRHPTSQVSSQGNSDVHRVGETVSTRRNINASGGGAQNTCKRCSCAAGITETGSHRSITSATDIRRVVDNQDDGMPTSNSGFPLKERNVHRNCIQEP